MIKKISRLTNSIKRERLKKCSFFYFIGCLIEKSTSLEAVKKPMLGIQLWAHSAKVHEYLIFPSRKRG